MCYGPSSAVSHHHLLLQLSLSLATVRFLPSPYLSLLSSGGGDGGESQDRYSPSSTHASPYVEIVVWSGLDTSRIPVILLFYPVVLRTS